METENYFETQYAWRSQIHLHITEEWQAISAVVLQVSTGLSQWRKPFKHSSSPKCTGIFAVQCDKGFISYTGNRPFLQIPNIPSKFLGKYFPDNHSSAHFELWDLNSKVFLLCPAVKWTDLSNLFLKKNKDIPHPSSQSNHVAFRIPPFKFGHLCWLQLG